MTPLTLLRASLLAGGTGHVSTMHRIPSAQSCSCSFVTKVRSQFAAGGVWGRSFIGLANTAGVKFGEMLCRSAMIKGVPKDSQFPKSHNLPYDVKLMRISSTIWEGRSRRPRAEFISTYGTYCVCLKTFNDTWIWTLYPLLKATKSRRASWLETMCHKWRNKFI